MILRPRHKDRELVRATLEYGDAMRKAQVLGMLSNAAGGYTSDEALANYRERFMAAAAKLPEGSGRPELLAEIVGRLFTETLADDPKALMGLAPAFLLLCGDREEGDLFAAKAS
jgi:hypothetical protein